MNRENFLKFAGMKLSFIPAVGIALLLGTSLCGCDDAVEFHNDPLGNFDALWSVIDRQYCYFDEKDLDWNAIREKYRPMIDSEMTQSGLFDSLSDMLDELKDGHVNLTAPFSTSYYRAWWSDYPSDFRWRTIQQDYLDFNYYSVSGISYAVFATETGRIGYMYYPSFSTVVGEGSLDYIMSALQDCNGLIIDIRDNGGGLLTNIDVLVGRLIDSEVSGGSIRHKTGPGHDDFSDPYPISYKPADKERVKWNGAPVVLLTNRGCYSAANDFAAVMKSLPNVTLIGARTGGGGGLPFSSELPNGWGIRFSASPITDTEGNPTEFGIDPDIEVHAPDQELIEGKDAILNAAVKYLVSNFPA